jgi:SecD/SecF fusion protein
MQNKGILWFFVILLGLATLYFFSLSFVSSRFEKGAREYAVAYVDSIRKADWSDAQVDSAILAVTKSYLRDSAEAKIYPVLGNTYRDVKKNQLNLGLDLQGGMSVTLEVSIADLLMGLSERSEDANFNAALKKATEMQKRSSASYMSLFEQAWKEQNAGYPLWRVFSMSKSSDLFPMNATDDEVFDVLNKEADNAIRNTENIIKKRIDNLGVAQPNIQKQSVSGRIVVELPGVDDREDVRKKLKTTANLEFWPTYKSSELYGSWQAINDSIAKTLYPELFVSDKDTAAADSSLTQLATSDTTAVAADTTLAAGADADSTAADEEEAGEGKKELTEEDRKKNPLLTKLGPMLAMDRGTGIDQCMVAIANVKDTAEVNRMLAGSVARNFLPKDIRLLWGAQAEGNAVRLYAIKDESGKRIAPLDGSVINSAGRDIYEGKAIVDLTMDASKGAPVWKKMTEKAAADNQRPIAIVMDDLVYSAPNVNEPIPNGRSQISFGNGPIKDQIQEADDLSGLLKAGSVPARITILDEVTVGATLGEKNISSGIWAFIIAFVVILFYMIFYYAWAGLAANVALIANLFFMMGALIACGGSLTLPGIAGIVLTMGMAVDANVLIYERVKEELRMGKAVQPAMRDGFIKAISAIIDGNATTLLTGIVLFVVGTGPIKGFATTLIIGIFTTLFTAIVVARLILYRRLENKRPISFASNITKNWFTKVNYDFVGKRKVFYVVSLLLIGAGFVSIAVRNPSFNMGVDFAGGTSFNVAFDNDVDADALRSALGTAYSSDGQSSGYTVQSIENSGRNYKVVTNYLISSDAEDVEKQVLDKTTQALSASGVPFQIISSVKVDPTMSDDFRKEAIWSSLIGLLLVGLYVFIRFRMVNYALGAIVALAHDALMVVAAFSLLNGIVPFSLEVNQAFIGAILTVIGYSINDTVVIFDRIREYLRNRRGDDMKSTINDALNSTLGRTINTSMTVLLTLLVMFIFGSDDIRGFCFAMIVGVVSGSYSTLFIATPIVVDFHRWFSKGDKAESAAAVKPAAA